MVARQSEAKHLTAVIHGVLRLLGWSLAEEGLKAPEFSSSTNALGVTIDVSQLHLGVAEIDNTTSRKEDLAMPLRGIRRSNTLTSIQALKLQGRMQFTAGQLSGELLGCVLTK